MTSPRSSFGQGTVVVLAVALLSISCDRSSRPAAEDLPAPDPSARSAGAAGSGSHARMAAELAEIRRRSDQEDHWQGKAPARRARAQLASLPPGVDPLVRWRVLRGVAEQELRLGNAERAIEILEEAYALLPSLAGRVDPVERARSIYRLGVAHMRLGETTNCSLHGGAESCILPIRGRAVHVDPRGSRAAMERFLEVLATAPRESSLVLDAAWLLHLVAMTLGEYPGAIPEALRFPSGVFEGADFARFENVAPATGVDTVDLFGGAIFDDFTGDDRIDLLTTSFDLESEPRFFVGDGNGGFDDRSAQAGLSGLWGGLNLIQGDVDGDGDLDVYVLRGAWLHAAGRHPNSLWLNDGQGRFTDVTFEAGLGEVHYPTQTAAFADFDLDGDLDLFVGNEHGDGRERVGLEGDGEGAFDAPSQLFRNDGSGRFVDVAAVAGVDLRAFVKGVAWGDVDGDRYPDLYVSVLGDSNHLFRNRGDGTFADITELAGVAGPSTSFPVWFWDYDNDGALDLFVPSYRGAEDGIALVAASALGIEIPWEMPRLYRGDGRGGFQDVAREAGLDRLVLPMGSNFGDVDGDGWLDFYLGTGYPDYEALMPNVLYHSVPAPGRAGRRFEDVTWAAGVGHLQKGHAVAFADFDRDGDLDLFAQMGGAFPGDRFANALFLNPGFGHRWVLLHLVGVDSNRSAIGARIRIDVVERGVRRSIYRWVGSGGSFGASPLRQHVGLGAAERIERIVIDWPSVGSHSTFESPELDRGYRVTEGRETLEPIG
ncbi:MAG TPA: CRTAC1 family protein [Thermoanaerobaculia bacterium]|nr:CRTAC1 family protein [Thermoanaerobaculia bacterium]